MSRAKHTPGEWYADEFVVRSDVGSCPIALVRELRGMVSEQRLPGESWLEMRRRTDPERQARRAEMHANSRLIAAAPDLLEALQRARIVFDREGLGAWDKYPAECDTIDAAIKKATGEQP